MEENHTAHPELPAYIRQVPQAFVDSVRLKHIEIKGRSISQSDEELDQLIVSHGGGSVDELIEAIDEAMLDDAEPVAEWRPS